MRITVSNLLKRVAEVLDDIEHGAEPRWDIEDLRSEILAMLDDPSFSPEERDALEGALKRLPAPGGGFRM